MSFFEIYFEGLLFIIIFFTIVWVISVFIQNASIVDIFWGLGFVLVNSIYFFRTVDFSTRKLILLALVTLWGLRLSIHIFIRNLGKPEDYRYQNFRKHYGEHRYWWFSYFQVFLLQGFLVWVISAPLLSVQFFSTGDELNIIDIFAIILWITGFIFEAGGDFQLYRFKSKPENKGKVLQSGFWKYTRHPNYFGDAAVWWSYGLFSIAVGSYVPLISALIMTWLLIKVSGVSMLERTLPNTKPEYRAYMKKTSAFIPWIPKKSAHENN